MSLHKDGGYCSCPMCAGQSGSDEDQSSVLDRQAQMAPTYNNTQVIGQISSGAKWSGAQISYGFLQSSPSWDIGYEGNGFSAFTAYQANATRAIMVLWDDLIARSITEQTSSQQYANVKFGNTTTSISYAHAYYPGNYSWAGEVWLNAATYSGLYTPDPGDYYWMTILHEVGHAIGLSHPGNYNGGSPTYANDAVYAQDTHQWTVMSYFSASNTGADWNGGSGWQYAQTPMVHDVLTIQSIYGADLTTRTGNTVYGFNSNAGNAVYDFSSNQSPVLTIYDAGGTDTLDLSGFSLRAIINLAPGTYSSAGGTTSTMTYNIGIAGNTWIENAIGGSGNDTIYGNDLANQLSGSGGNDHLYGYGGNDTISGGSGTDWVYFSLSLASYTFQISQNFIQVSASDVDVVFNDIEWFAFSDTSVSYTGLVNLWSYTTVESVGDYELGSTPGQYFIRGSSGSDIGIINNGAAVGPNSYSGWSAIQVEEGTGGKFLVLWKNTSGNYGLWEVSSTGVTLSSASVNPVDYEVTFGVDLNLDGQIGPVASGGSGGSGGATGTVVESDGDYELVSKSGQYFIRDSGNNDIGITSNGKPVGPTTYSGWSAVQAEEGTGGKFLVLWKNTAGNYGLWEISATGATLASYSVNPVNYEVTFDADLNQDGQIGTGGSGGSGGSGGTGGSGGSTVTVVESNGDYDLVSKSGQYYIRDASNNDVGITSNGKPVGPTTYSGWSAVQAEEGSNGNFLVLWKNTSGSYGLWEVGSSGATLASYSVKAADYEVTFDADLNQDGQIGTGGSGGTGGSTGTVIESNGDYDLVSKSGQYFIRDAGNNDVGITSGGKSVGPTSYSGWTATQAEEGSNGNFLVLWQGPGGKFGVWEISSTGATIASWSVNPADYEITFEVDLDNDGQVGAQPPENPADAGNNENWFFGTDGDDVFVFADDAAHYTISGFGTGGSAGQDVIDLSAFEFYAYNDGSEYDLQSAMTQDGANVVLTTASGSVTLLDVSLAALQEDHFIF